jgi:phosphate transport system ATP-binding protein
MMPVLERRTEPTQEADTMLATAEPWPLRLEHLKLTVGAATILEDITMEVAPRQVTCLVGPSGSGKSSLLRVLNRLWDGVPGARVGGSARFGPVDLYARDTDPLFVRRAIGMVFQRPTPFPRSIYDNLALPLRIAGVPRREIPDRVEQALRLAAVWDDVKDRLHASALTLSGGQQQRLSIARALAVEPKVLLMDEPASALDPPTRDAIARLVRDLGRRLTVVLVTHSLEEARRLADTVAVLIAGRLEAFGAPSDVFGPAAPPAVAAYLYGSAYPSDSP